MPVEPSWTELLASLVPYARRRLESGEGSELVAELQAKDVALLTGYAVGFLPRMFLDSLPSNLRPPLEAKRLGNSLLLPAVDERGVPVDGLCVQKDRDALKAKGLQKEPHGLLGAKVAATNDSIVVVDTFRLLAQYWARKQNVVLLRGTQDAQTNAERLYSLGVRQALVVAWRNGEDMALALQNAGIAVDVHASPKNFGKGDELPASIIAPEEAVQPPAPAATPANEYPQAPTLKNYDPRTEEAVFVSGDATYTVEVTVESDSKLQVKLERLDKRAVDRFDLSSEVQRKRFAVSAALRVGVPCEVIEEHLLCILEESKRIQREQLNPLRPSTPKVLVSEEERKVAVEFLKSANLLDQIAADLEELGWVGEPHLKRLLYLIGVSRKLPKPLSAAMRAPSGSGKSHGMETTALLTPPEDVLHLSRLTDSSLYYQNDALKHRLLVIDEAEGLSRDVCVALRVLQSRGSLTQSAVDRDADGQVVTKFLESQGPVAILTSSAGAMEQQLLSRCYDLTVDDSAEQTAKILESQRRTRCDAHHHGKQEKIIQRHHALQRVLESKPVVIPYCGRIEFPSSSPKYRREQERFLCLIEASALLHQFQRTNVDGCVVASVDDFNIAVNLAGEHVAKVGDELSREARELLGAVTGAGLSSFATNDLKPLLPTWTRHRLLTALDELLGLELLSSPRMGRGVARRYDVQPGARETLSAPQVKLRPEVVEVVEGLRNNFTPEAATG